MEKNINEFDKEFATQISKIKDYENIKIKNAAIKEYKSKILEEINIELDNKEKELKNLNTQLDILTSSYCEEHGHQMKLIDIKFKKYTGKTTYRGIGTLYEYIYKCCICGNTINSRIETFDELPHHVEQYKVLLPNEISHNPKYQEIQSQIAKLKNYTSYLENLKTILCKLFGHDVEIQKIEYYSHYSNNECINYKCTCCGKHLSEKEYQDNISKFNYNEIDVLDNIDLSLPSFEDYQRKLKK